MIFNAVLCCDGLVARAWPVVQQEQHKLIYKQKWLCSHPGVFIKDSCKSCVVAAGAHAALCEAAALGPEARRAVVCGLCVWSESLIGLLYLQFTVCPRSHVLPHCYTVQQS
jgi:hypothetical protein